MQDFMDSMNWDDVKVQKGGMVRHGHRINIQNLSEEGRNIIRRELESLGIRFEERQATRDTPLVKKEDLTFRVIESESVEKLRQEYFDPSPRKDLPIRELITSSFSHQR